MGILLDAPLIGGREKQALNRCLDEGYVSTFGPFVPKFEEAFAAFVKAPAAVSVQSGTAGLHVALRELGIGPGDEVIVPATTFIATINSVCYQGATPVLADVDPATWTLAPEAFEAAITTKTKAVIPVHLYGVASDMKAILDIAEKHGIQVLEDATEGLCTQYEGAALGTIGSFGVFSFNGNKLMTTGGGGMVVGRSADAMEHIRFLVNQAKNPGAVYTHAEIGFNYRMTNLEASLGLAQLSRLDEFSEKRKHFFKDYQSCLEGLDGIAFQAAQTREEETVRWLTSVKLPDEASRERLQAQLADQGIPTRRVFPPLSMHPPFAQEDAEKRYPAAYELFSTGLNLPSSSANSPEDIRSCAEAIATVVEAL